MSVSERIERPRILIIDDDHALQRSLMRLLGLRWNAVCASSRADALAFIHAGQRDVILSDVRMPSGEGGISIAEEIVESYEIYRGRFVFMSGSLLSRRDAARVAALKGAFELKPIELERSLVVLSRAAMGAATGDDSMSGSPSPA